MTIDEIIDGILEREGPGKAPWWTKDDAGGRTSWGISERWHPEAWRNGPPTRDEAEEIYKMEYVAPFDKFVDPLRTQLVDIAVLHGQSRAWRLLNKTIDGSDSARPAFSLNNVGLVRLVNNALVAHRLGFIDTLTDEHSTQKKFEEGWESRALAFLV